MNPVYIFFAVILAYLSYSSFMTDSKTVDAKKTIAGCPFRHTAMNNDGLSAVERHASIYANVEDGKLVRMTENGAIRAHTEKEGITACVYGKLVLTKDGMTRAHTEQGITDGVYVKTWAIKNLLDDRKKAHTPADVAKVVNPARTGIWDEKGNFNEGVFLTYAKSAIKIPNAVSKKDGSAVKEDLLTLAIVTDVRHQKKWDGTIATKLGTCVFVYLRLI